MVLSQLYHITIKDFELNHNLSAYFSQSTEILYNFLIQNLFSAEKSLFLKRIILVPSPLMKNWLVKKMADDRGISMGVEIVLQEQGMKKIAELLSLSPGKTIPSPDQLAFAFQLLVPQLYAEFPQLKSFLDNGNGNRLFLFCQELASLFFDYGVYGASMLEEWEKKPLPHWQATLWHLLKEKFPDWGSTYQKYQGDVSPPAVSFEIHLFAMSYLPPMLLRFLEKLPLPVYFYQLSPTQTFWEDTLSGSQRRYLCKVWEAKGSSPDQIQELNRYLKETHSLLANWGKLGRMMVKELPQEMFQYQELYPVPSEAFSLPEYEERLYPENIPVEIPLTLLSRLQTDLTTMRPIPEETIACVKDLSIQVHRTSCKRREVEEVYNIIVGIIDRHQNDEEPITPDDIVVMAPDIMEYAPYIQSYFDRKESILDYRLMDIALPTHDPCIRGLNKILSLVKSRWESASIKDLLQMETFRKPLGITIEEVLKLEKWIDDNAVIWGMDKKHHSESLTLSHCGEGVEVHQGTWECFFERALRGVFTVYQDDVALHETDVLPYSKIDLSDTDLLGKWVELIYELYTTLKEWEKKEETLLEWSLQLEKLILKFLGSPSKPMEFLLHQLRQTAVPFGEDKFSFEAVSNWLENIFGREKTGYREQHLHSIRFCSLLPMRAIPAKVVILCGMSDGNFPRLELESSLNLLKGESKADPKPKKIDFDRYLILETILSARSYLVFTYSVAAEEQGPSLMITELLDLLDRYYRIEEKPVSEEVHFRHPFERYDRAYFNELPNYSPLRYQEALASISPNKKTLAPFISKFEMENYPSQMEKEIFLPLRELDELARDPLAFYYKKSLGITLKNEEEIKTERTLSLSPLHAAMIPRNALKGDLEEQMLLSKKRGDLPEGVFEEIAKRAIAVKSNHLREMLRKVGVEPHELVDFSFENECFHPESLPSVYLSGTIPDISPEGLVIHKKEKNDAYYNYLPRILLFHYFVQKGSLSSKPQLILSGTGTVIPLTRENPQAQIEHYLTYWKLAKQNPSPLVPSWIEYIIEGNLKGLDKEIHDSFKEKYSAYERVTKDFDLVHLMESPWVEWVRRLFDAPL